MDHGAHDDRCSHDIITAAYVTADRAGDAPQLPGLLQATAKRFYVPYPGADEFTPTPAEEKLERLALVSLAEMTNRPQVACGVVFASGPGPREFPRSNPGDRGPQPFASNILEAPMIGNVVCQGFTTTLTEQEKAFVEARFPGQLATWAFA